MPKEGQSSFIQNKLICPSFCPRYSQQYPLAPQCKSINFPSLAFLNCPAPTVIHHYSNVFTSRTFVGTDIVLSFMTLYRPVIPTLPMAILLVISDVQPPSLANLAPRKVKLSPPSNVSPAVVNSPNSPNVSTTFVFFAFNRRPDCSIFFFTLVNSILRTSISASSVVSPVYQRLVIFRPPILTPCAISSRPVLLIIFLLYRLNEYADNIQPCHTPFLILNHSVLP